MSLGELFCKHPLNQPSRLLLVLSRPVSFLNGNYVLTLFSGAPMNAQKVPNDFVRAFRRQVKHMPSGDEINPFKKWQPWRRVIYWFNTRIQNAYISRELDKRFALRGTTQSTTETKRSKPIIDIALDVYLQEKIRDKTTSNIDEGFKALAINQIKLFLFAGT